MKGILNYRNIYVKVFGETPMADMEVILPEKVVGIKALTLVNLAVTIATALSTGALMLWRVRWSLVAVLVCHRANRRTTNPARDSPPPPEKPRTPQTPPTPKKPKHRPAPPST